MNIHGRKFIHAEAKKSIKGTLYKSLILWENLSNSPEEMGYQRN